MIWSDRSMALTRPRGAGWPGRAAFVFMSMIELSLAMTACLIVSCLPLLWKLGNGASSNKVQHDELRHSTAPRRQARDQRVGHHDRAGGVDRGPRSDRGGGGGAA